MLNRRHFVQTTALAGLALSSRTLWAANSNVRVGMCDWNVRMGKEGGSAKPECITAAKEAGLEGIQVSVGTNPDSIALRDPKVREKYLALGKEHGIQFHSVAAGSILNQIPLASEPQSAVYVIDAIEAAHALGAKNILIAFFGNGDLRLKDATGKNRDLSQDQWKEWELNSQSVTRVVEVLRQIVPRAEALGVVLGLENTLSAKQNMEIIDRIGAKSNIVQVYYDVGNSTGNGYNITEEIRALGNDLICEIHIKDLKTPMVGSAEASVNLDEVAKACHEIKYDKWYVLETSGRENRFQEDTQANVAMVKQKFA